MDHRGETTRRRCEMSKAYEKFTLVIAILIFLGLMYFVGSIKIGVWNECRTDQSFWYCWSLISK
jgi:hypothetical protein